MISLDSIPWRAVVRFAKFYASHAAGFLATAMAIIAVAEKNYRGAASAVTIALTAFGVNIRPQQQEVVAEITKAEQEAKRESEG